MTYIGDIRTELQAPVLICKAQVICRFALTQAKCQVSVLLSNCKPTLRYCPSWLARQYVCYETSSYVK